MAKPVHKQITKVLGFILLVVLVASFAFFGAGSIATQQGAIVATVGNQKVTATDFDQAFQNEIARYREQFGAEFDTQQALNIGLDRVVVNQLVQGATLDQLAEDLGLLGSSEEVRSIILETDAFQDISGNFSEFTYKQRLLGAGIKVEDFENDIRLDIARTQLYTALTETVVLPASLVEVLYKHRKESRRGTIATIPASGITGIAAPTDEDLAVYYEDNKGRFSAPEYRNLTFMIVKPEHFAENIDLNEEDLREEYDIRYDDFNDPEVRNLEVAVFREENQANQLYSRVAAGEDFTAVAVALTGFQEDELNLGDKNAYDISDDYGNVAAERVFAAPLDGVTEPTQSLNAWQVFHVTGITPGKTTTFEESLEELRQLVAADRGIDNLYNAVALIDNDILSGVSLDQISISAGIPVINVEATSAQGQTPGGTLIAEVQVFPYLNSAFALHEDDRIELIEADNDVFYIIKVNSITAPAPPPLEDIKEQVSQTWTYEEQTRLSGVYANQALLEIEAGASLAEVAATYGGISFDTATYRRDRVFTQRELSAGIAGLMFSLEEGGVGIEQDVRGDGYLILKVTEIKSQNPALDQIEFQALVERLQLEMQNDLFLQLLATLKNDYDVYINTALIDNLYNPDRQVGASPF